MQLRKLLILLGVLSLLVSRSVMALGLGDIKLNSSLNEPLDAHISLIDIGDLGQDQIIARLADEEDFRRLGIAREFFYTQLRFNVVTDQAGGPFIAVTSKDPVREPYLSFVVEVRWTSGRLLREYTVLLDLPVFADEESARPIEAAATARSTSAVKNEPVRTARESGAVSANRPTAGDVYGPVKANDTLWDIAREVKPGRASIQQAMIAIQRANPNAFIKGNINLLRKGQVLRIPSAQEINSVTTREAISLVAQQNSEWSGNSMGAPLDASGSSASLDRSGQAVRGQVRLTAPGTTGEGGTAQGGGYGSGDAARLAEELAATEEELERSLSENSELRARVADLEEQIETMERLLEVSNEQLSALQAGSAMQQDAASDTAVTPAGEDSTLAQQEELYEESVESQSSSSQAVADEPEAAASSVASKTQASKVVISRPPEPSLMDKIMANILWIGLAVIALIVALFVILRKRSGASEPEQEFTAEFDDSVFSLDDAESEEEAPLDETEESVEEASAEEEVNINAEAETGDAVSEADIYIALGNYGRAEGILLNALAKEPDSQPIQLKLLEVYAESDNRSAFEDTYRKLMPQADAATAEKARQLQEQHFGPLEDDFTQAEPKEDEANDAPAESQADEAFELDDLDLDDDTEDQKLESDDELLELDTAEDEDLSLDDLEFDLDDEDDEAVEDEKPATDELDIEGPSGSYDLSFDSDETEENDAELLDFDLDLDDEPAAEQQSADEPEDEPLDLDTLEAELPESSASGDEGDDVFTLELDDEEDDSLSLDQLAADAPEEDDFDLTLDDEGGAAQDEAEPSAAEEPPTLDLADEEADDFDLDQALSDVDLEALDREMADLDEVPVQEESASAAQDEDSAQEDLSVDEDATFDEALSSLDEGLDLDDLPSPEAASDAGGDDDDLDFLADADEVATKLDLARAYIDMGDMEGAKDILSEVTEEGSDEQKQEAQALLEKVDS